MAAYFDHVTAEVLARAKRVRLLSLDVDGVLTDGVLLMTERGETMKAFNTLDGLGIKLLRQAGVEVALVTGRKSAMVADRARSLGIEHIYMHCEEKGRALAELREKLGLESSMLAHMGDDLPDLSAMNPAGLAIAVPNGHPLVIEHAHYCTQRSGGHGAVREACDLILHARGALKAVVEPYYPRHD